METTEEMTAAMRRFDWPDYLVFTAMLIISGAIGVYYGFIAKQKTTAEYLVGGRNMGTLPVSMSLVAT